MNVVSCAPKTFTLKVRVSAILHSHTFPPISNPHQSGKSARGLKTATDAASSAAPPRSQGRTRGPQLSARVLEASIRVFPLFRRPQEPRGVVSTRFSPPDRRAFGSWALPLPRWTTECYPRGQRWRRSTAAVFSTAVPFVVRCVSPWLEVEDARELTDRGVVG